MSILHRIAGRMGQAAVDSGIPPRALGYRWVAQQTVRDYLRRRPGSPGARLEIIHSEAIARNPLPGNVPDRQELPADRGWWGYSFRDVPERVSAETFVATVPDCRLAFYRDPQDDFYVGILTGDGHSLTLPQIVFRPRHGRALHSPRGAVRMRRATWFVERVYHNYSHWLTAHLPKLLLLKERGELDELVLPPELSANLRASLRRLGLDPERFRTFDPSRPLHVDELTVVSSDRFRPELLRPVRDALGEFRRGQEPWRRLFISRSKAARRRLLNEEALWPLLRDTGFDRIWMEDLSFDEQVRLMGETHILLAPHGAGLTNMMFCPPGAHIVEIADLSFPNPNFYALACAMGHHYWLVPGRAIGDVHPLEKDLQADPAAVAEILRNWL